MTLPVEVDMAAWRPAITMIPVIVAAGLWVAVGDVRRRAAAILALLWNLVGLLLVNVVAMQLGWWRFTDVGAAVLGVPVDLLIAWAVLWSVIPVLVAQWTRPVYAVTALILLDVYAMPALDPVVILRADWWWGEVVAVLTCLLPAVILAELTATRRMLRTRVVLQVAPFTAVLIVGIPVLAYELAGAQWLWTTRIGGIVDSILIQIAGVVALVALTAVVEFCRAGGTPWPWDAPERLITTGPYAYVANPMQLCGTLLIALTGALLGLPMLYVAAVVAAAFSAGIAAYVEHQSLTERFGPVWVEYRAGVRNWVPRWRPAWVGPPARVYLARGCDPCSELAGWITERSPRGLDTLDAEDHPEPLRRMRYETADGSMSVTGIRAFGAVLAHIDLAWAVTGWIIATPGISHALQLIVDAAGGGPRDIGPRTAAGTPDAG